MLTSFQFYRCKTMKLNLPYQEIVNMIGIGHVRFRYFYIGQVLEPLKFKRC